MPGESQPERSVVAQAMDVLTREIAQCGDLVAIVCDRVAPILTPTEKGYTTDEGQRVTSSPLASQIYDQVDCVVALSTHLTFTIERLEI